MSGVYISDELAEHLDRAQELIYRHLTGCAMCATNRHCYERARAEGMFARYGLLPRRTPGLTRRPPRTDWDA
ncbi:hypothetical protein [Virgisporangium aurantiacum]|uniref:Uncharacterized protein n=1 Tax=Virgisporangium aurantiacum TaxID=175570 RepID=A0A8J4E6P5_9ACTN|nr:hypothetical protein [Virgisporangium aurantiacum]GIJ63373.1 hypothetical protein Vau01_108890 [Virgisporangium aurantiacum]